MRRAVLAGVVALAAAFPGRADSLTYVNDRFGTRITFPLDVFDAIDPPPVNGDGRRFRSADGAELAAYGRFNTLDETPGTLLDRRLSDAGDGRATITYSASGPDWVVLSGLVDGDIVYERHEFGADGVIHAMEMRYPALGSALYDSLVAEIAGSLDGP